jgi:hypothetical protein
LGLVSHLTCTSSYSGGFHLYFPLSSPQSSWELAVAVTALLESTGLKLSAGQLELFPDPKPYRVEGTASLFNAHRLPMQAGSYLVNSDFQPVWSSPERFVEQWQLASDQNLLDRLAIKRIIKQVKRCCYQISGKADKFVNDLNAEIEPGWTGKGQTNYLLGRITMRAYIFNHILTNSPPLEGQALISEIVRTAKSLPGYEIWCQHQHEIEHRATEWANCIENSHYFHYGDQKGRYKGKLEPSDLEPAASGLPSWNQQQSDAARERIKLAVAQLLDMGTLPVRPTARFKALVQSGVGGGSLYRHRDLWHPDYFDSHCLDHNQELEHQTSLLDRAGGDNLLLKDSSDLASDSDSIEGNNSNLAPVQDERAAQTVVEPRASLQQIRTESGQQAHSARIQCRPNSGNPILVVEALARFTLMQLPRPDD